MPRRHFPAGRSALHGLSRLKQNQPATDIESAPRGQARTRAALDQASEIRDRDMARGYQLGLSDGLAARDPAGAGAHGSLGGARANAEDALLDPRDRYRRVRRGLALPPMRSHRLICCARAALRRPKLWETQLPDQTPSGPGARKAGLPRLPAGRLAVHPAPRAPRPPQLRAALCRGASAAHARARESSAAEGMQGRARG